MPCRDPSRRAHETATPKLLIVKSSPYKNRLKQVSFILVPCPSSMLPAWRWSPGAFGRLFADELSQKLNRLKQCRCLMERRDDLVIYPVQGKPPARLELIWVDAEWLQPRSLRFGIAR